MPAAPVARVRVTTISSRRAGLTVKAGSLAITSKANVCSASPTSSAVASS